MIDRDPPNADTPITPEEAKECAEGDPFLREMIEKGLPLTRNNYLRYSMTEHRDEWDAEDELALPECFQDRSRYVD